MAELELLDVSWSDSPSSSEFWFHFTNRTEVGFQRVAWAYLSHQGRFLAWIPGERVCQVYTGDRAWASEQFVLGNPQRPGP